MKEEDTKKIILDIRKYGFENYDKQLVYLAGGALGLSISIGNGFIKSADSSFPILIVIAWIMLVSSLITNLFSHKKTIMATDAWLDEQDESDSYEVHNRHVTALNLWSLWLFLIGLIFFILYISINILK